MRRARCADILYFICSDVTLDRPERAVQRALEVFADPGVGIYAPAMNASGHRHMRHRPQAGMRRVSFAEGVCFAVRTELLARACPLDLSINALGWGVDVFLGYLAWCAGLKVVVDHMVVAEHRGICGYDVALAAQQRDAFFAHPARPARLFRRLTGFGPAKTRIGWRAVQPLLRASTRLMHGPGPT